VTAMPSPICFLDMETTGLDPVDDEIWEAAAVRRDPSGDTSTLHLFVEHDLELTAHLPDSFRADHDARYDPVLAVSREVAAKQVQAFTAQRAGWGIPAIIGCVPSFDMHRLELLMRRFGLAPGYHYRPVCVETVAVGWLLGRAQAGVLPPGMTAQDVREVCDPPWSADAVSRACGAEPPGEGVRHTAMGDVRWGISLWDWIHGGSTW
jgi:hypothetical protein